MSTQMKQVNLKNKYERTIYNSITRETGLDKDIIMGTVCLNIKMCQTYGIPRANICITCMECIYLNFFVNR